MMQDLSGKVLEERYFLDRRLGKGGQGDVYLAKDLYDANAVWAAKVLRRQNPEAAKRFKQEIMLAKECAHPHFVRLHDFNTTPEGQMYYIMEYIDGVTLRELLKFTERRPLPWQRVVRILIQICDALGSAHDKNIIHRDIKLENFMLVHRQGKELDYVKVLDLGIAKLINPRADQAHFVLSTKTGVWLTPEYSAPEFLFQGVCTIRSDIYSLGIVAFELLTGSRPFSGETPAELARRHKEVLPDVPSNHVPHAQWPPELDATVLKALHKEPASRFSSMREMSLHLYNLLHDLGQISDADVIDFRRRTRRRLPSLELDVDYESRSKVLEEKPHVENITLARVSGWKQSGATTLLKLVGANPTRASRGRQATIDGCETEETRKRPRPKKPKRTVTKQMSPSGGVAVAAINTTDERREDGVKRWRVLFAVLPQVAGLLFLSFVASTIVVLLLVHTYTVPPKNTLTVHDAAAQEGVPLEVVARWPSHPAS